MISEALRKLAFIFTQLENTKHLVYNHIMEEIVPLIKGIYDDLTTVKESIVELDESVFVFIIFNETRTACADKDDKYERVPLPIVKLNTGIATSFEPILLKVLPEVPYQCTNRSTEYNALELFARNAHPTQVNKCEPV
jgi:hypothetical protein